MIATLTLSIWTANATMMTESVSLVSQDMLLMKLISVLYQMMTNVTIVSSTVMLTQKENNTLLTKPVVSLFVSNVKMVIILTVATHVKNFLKIVLQLMKMEVVQIVLTVMNKMRMETVSLLLLIQMIIVLNIGGWIQRVNVMTTGFQVATKFVKNAAADIIWTLIMIAFNCHHTAMLLMKMVIAHAVN